MFGLFSFPVEVAKVTDVWDGRFAVLFLFFGWARGKAIHS